MPARPFQMRRAGLIMAIALLALASAGYLHFRLVLVLGESMSPGLHTGDVLLVDRRAYRQAEPQRGDVVLARHGQELIVKRVVGVPGEEVSLRQGHVFVNGEPIVEHHAIEPGPLDITAGTLFKGKFALLGDNRALPITLVVHAVVSKDELIGRVVRTFRSKPIAICGKWLAGNPS